MKKYKLNLLAPATPGSGKMWEYRGFIIKQWDNDYLHDPDVRGYQYNIYSTLADYQKGSSIDILRTLREAKDTINQIMSYR